MKVSALLFLLLLCSCSASQVTAHYVHWKSAFVNGQRAPLGSADDARAAALRYLREQDGYCVKYILDSVSVYPNGHLWMIGIPKRNGGTPDKSVMALKSKNGRVGWLPLK